MPSGPPSRQSRTASRSPCSPRPRCWCEQHLGTPSPSRLADYPVKVGSSEPLPRPRKSRRSSSADSPRGTSTSSSAPTGSSPARRGLQGPRAARRRRGAALRREAQGATEEAPGTTLDVLTLSATPIPRTLYLSLSGRARPLVDPDPTARPDADLHARAAVDGSTPRPRRSTESSTGAGRPSSCTTGSTRSTRSRRRSARSSPRRASAWRTGRWRGGAGRGHARVRRRGGRRPRLLVDHRERARRPECEHAHRRPRRPIRSVPALSDPRSGRAIGSEGLLLPPRPERRERRRGASDSGSSSITRSLEPGTRSPCATSS